MITDRGVSSDIDNQSNIGAYAWIGPALMISAILIGLMARFKGIGRWPFAYDEFLIAQSVEHILKTGLPMFESGGYYTRGLLYQYLSAGLVWFFGNPEFWLRAIPAAFNMMSVPALYWLGKRIGGKVVAYAAVILCMLSIWEIEFSRFARMYALFQAIFLWYLVALYKAVLEDDSRGEIWMYVLSATAILAFEGAIFLALLNFLPTVYRRRLNILSYSLWVPLLIAIGTYLFITADFRRMGLDNALPDGFVAPSGGDTILFPSTMLPILFSHPIWTVSFFLLAAVNAFLAYRIVFSAATPLDKFFFLIIVLAALFHQFGIVAGISVLLVAIYHRRLKESWRENRYNIVTAVALSFAFWIVVGIAGDMWHQIIPGIENPGLTKYFLLLFNYPDVYAQVFYQWLAIMPKLVLFLGGGVTIAFIVAIFSSQEDYSGIRFLLAVLVAMVLLVGLIQTPYHSTRYTFFIYPGAIIIFAASVSIMMRRRVKTKIGFGIFFSLAISAYILLAEDYRFMHLYRIDSPEYNFRHNFSKRLESHYYFRIDYRTPADIIDKAAAPGDLVVSLFTPTAYYLDRLDYLYFNDPKLIMNYSALNGKKELFTHTNLILEKEQLWALIENSATPIWIISASDTYRQNPYIAEISKEIGNRYSPNIFGRSVDQKILVYHIRDEKGRP
ncbi:MAG: hypothetical protein VR64_03400 [Desulfatitalea sp. BRH_c12]|nr:MAG: hypothetical protein VR64_03400 [Desulfatitalea sp. BRH_c12]